MHVGHRTRTGSPAAALCCGSSLPAMVAVGCGPRYSVRRTKLRPSLEMYTHH